MRARLLRRTATVGGLTLVSRVMGFLRDMVFARAFGAGTGLDAFFVAFKIPNFLRRLFAEGAFSQAFVPVLAEYRASDDPRRVKRLVDGVAGTLAGILALVTFIGVAASPVLVMVFAPGFLGGDPRFDLTAEMLRLTFPYILFISLAAFASGILNTWGRFGPPAFAPVLLNAVLIIAALWGAPRMEEPVMALAWAVLIAGVAQLIYLLPALKKLSLLPRPRWAWRDSGVQKIMRLMLPAIFGSSVVQINLLFDTLIASFLVTGSVSWLYFSDRMVEFPLGVFAIALATVILPSLSDSHAREDRQKFAATLDWAMRWVLVIGLPAMLGLVLLAEPVLSTLFQYQRFDVNDVRMSALSLFAYAAGLPAFMLVKVLAPGFYSRQDTRTPVRIGVIAMLWNMVLNVCFVVPMVWMGFAGPHAGLATATALSAYLNASLLYRGLRRAEKLVHVPGWSRLFAQVLIANGAMVGLLLWGVPPLEIWSGWDGGERAFQLTQWIALGGGAYIATLLISGLRPAALRLQQVAE